VGIRPWTSLQCNDTRGSDAEAGGGLALKLTLVKDARPRATEKSCGSLPDFVYMEYVIYLAAKDCYDHTVRLPM
jgi:hypothetical protein